MPAPDNSHERFMRLFVEHEPAILRLVLVFVPDRSDARDILQETAVALWNNFPHYDPPRPFLNWACGFARIEVRRFFSRCHRRARLSAAAVDAVMTCYDATAEQDELRERHLAECLQRLTRDQRRVIDGYYFEECTVEDLAARVGRSNDAVYKLLQRIRHALYDCMERKRLAAQR